MVDIILYHGTNEKNAKQIMKNGFVTGKNHNWDIKSKKGFVYLSSAYAPFYAMTHDTHKLALIKIKVHLKDLYPEDDFLMYALGKPKYTQKELDAVDLKKYKYLTLKSLEYMGNAAIKPKDIGIVGVTYFNGKNLIMKCDPVIAPINFQIMGDYYKELSDWIFEGKQIMEFRSFM